MIPLKLTLQGIYSYQKREVIDFQKLTQSGLFGIFGMVGSGKSTILEAISYVLYGQVERLNQRDQLSYNLMNLKSNELLIDYEFVASRDEQKYRFVVKSKRRKNFEDVATPERDQYRWNGKDWEPVEAVAEEILELSYENFRRTIIIPQGKFQEFLQLGDTDRTRMLKEIFNLQEYDLADKIVPLERENNDQILATKTNLEQVANVSAAIIAETQAKLGELRQMIADNVETLRQKNLQKADLEQVKLLFAEINQVEYQLSLRQVEATDWQRAELELKEYETCLFQFKDLLENKSQSEFKINNLKQEIFQKENLYEQINQQLIQTEQAFQTVKQQYDQREAKHQEAEEWRKIAQIQKLTYDLVSLQERLNKGKPMVQEKEDLLKQLHTHLEQKKIEVKEAKTDLPDLGQLNQLTSWFEQRTSILKTLQSATQDLRLHQAEIEKIQREKRQYWQTELQPLLGEAILTMPEEDISEEIDLKKGELELEINAIRDELTQLEVKNQLQAYATELKDGEPCPLCGSMHHPNILTAEFVQQHWEDANSRKYLKENELKELNEINTALNKYENRVGEQTKILDKFQRRMDHEQLQYDKHLGKFIWKDKGFDPDYPEDVEKLSTKAKRQQAAIVETEAEIEKLDADIAKNQKEKESWQSKLNEIEKELAGLQARQQEVISQIHTLNEHIHTQLGEKEIESKIRQLENDYQTITKTYQTLENQILEARKQETALQSELKIRRENLASEEQTQQDLTQKVAERLKQSEFDSIEKVSQILALKLDIQTQKQKIAAFYQLFNQLQNNLQNLQARAQGKTFVEAEFEQLLQNIQALDALTAEQQKEETRFEEQIKRLQSDLERKMQLEKYLGELELRREDINEMKKMFRGEGFVKYISTVYLQNLCNLANDRFYRLTRQRLKLEVNDNNNFQVRDFLNNGQTRSVKTLSGGQTFQASLSLALALADSIQRFTKSSQNFFFLDEGFGSQDDESLEIVFNTLTSLRHENRIVGIISHVEKLKDEIKVFLKIKNDEEEGSSIEKSWEVEAA
jgi:DNA repair protein SbcC/Rad50